MTIVLTGGGSGGHITPILAVAEAIKHRNPEARIVYVGHRGDPLSAVPKEHPSIDEAYMISAGKFRRYHGEGWQQMLDILTMYKNTRDVTRVLRGMMQAYRLLGKIRPDVIFTPGGYVGVPVGVAASRRRIPLITHDLDALPGMANRINARWAAVHAVGMPKELYAYDPEKMAYVGVPVNQHFKEVTKKLQQQYREQIGLSAYKRILLIAGGGQGAQRINAAVVAAAPQLLKDYADLAIVHIAGKLNEQQVAKDYDASLSQADRARVVVLGFTNILYAYNGAADLVITRAGAMSIAELAMQHKACIVIPNPVLTGGHQLKNAQPLAKAGAVRLVQEAEIANSTARLERLIRELLDDPAARADLGERLGTFAKPKATEDLVDLIMQQAQDARAPA